MGEGRMGGLGSGEWMPTSFLAVAADAAVLVYLSILEAPGMGGRGEGEKRRMGGLGSGEWMLTTFHTLAPRTQLFSSIFQFWMPLGWEGEDSGIGEVE